MFGLQRCGNHDVTLTDPANNVLLLRNFESKDAASGSTFRIRHLDADIVFACRRFRIGNVDTSRLRISCDARRDVDFGGLQINNVKSFRLDLGPTKDRNLIRKCRGERVGWACSISSIRGPRVIPRSRRTTTSGGRLASCSVTCFLLGD
jgi:hypothetical protein